jgi:tripartite-type tricarboxylate transporter receptor subunit TctC
MMRAQRMPRGACHPQKVRVMLGRRDFALGLASGLLAGASGAAMAQGASWPDHPPRWVVGYPPGGPSDTFARLIASFMSPRLGFNMVVENRPGGGAVLASETVARSMPDGYTLLHADNVLDREVAGRFGQQVSVASLH